MRSYFARALISISIVIIVSSLSFAQQRERIVQTQTERPAAQTQTHRIQNAEDRPLVRKTSSSRPVASAPARPGFSAGLKTDMLASINSKLGIPYRYGSNGPRSYDCSSFVWAVFGDIGIEFTRTSARVYWQTFEPVKGKQRYRFGNLVFFNKLGHVGIVVDEKGFYHASSSRGVTYSKFNNYWNKRIVGFRRVPLEHFLFGSVN